MAYCGMYLNGSQMNFLLNQGMLYANQNRPAPNLEPIHYEWKGDMCLCLWDHCFHYLIVKYGECVTGTPIN